MVDWSKLRRWLIANRKVTPEYLAHFERDCGKEATRKAMLETWYDSMSSRFREKAKRVCLGWSPMDPKLETMGLASRGKLLPWARYFLYLRARINPPEDVELRKAAEALVIFRQKACATYPSRLPKQFTCYVCRSLQSFDHVSEIREKNEGLTRLLEQAARKYSRRIEKLERPYGRKPKESPRADRL